MEASVSGRGGQREGRGRGIYARIDLKEEAHLGPVAVCLQGLPVGSFVLAFLAPKAALGLERALLQPALFSGSKSCAFDIGGISCSYLSWVELFRSKFTELLSSTSSSQHLQAVDGAVATLQWLFSTMK